MEMREIKFRAWDNGMYQNITIGSGMWTDNVREDIWHTGNVMQYTGLKDKNGVEIYEGDIVMFTGNRIINEKDIISAVTWGKWCYVINEFNQFDIIKARSFEVIGNIHENPDLLK